jgi:hypothetical protein
MAQEIRDVVFNVQVRTADGKVKIDGLTKGFVQADSAFKKMQSTLKTTNDALNKTGLNTGLANTAVLEFGRTVSDAPYGIQGMGNNITQLVTIMGQLSEKAKETGVSIGKSLRSALVGPLGIVIAVQIVIAAFEIFRKSQQDAKKDVDKLTTAIAKSGVELKIALDFLDSENVSLERKNEILDQLNKKYPEWNLQHSTTGTISDDNREKIENEISAIENLAKARALQSVVEELYAERARKLAEREVERSEQGEQEGFFKRARDRFNRMLASTGFYGSEQEQKAFDYSINEIDEKVNSVLDEFKDQPSLLAALLGSDKKGKVTKETKEKIKKLVVETYDLSIVEAAKYKKEVEKRAKELGIDYASIILGGDKGREELGKGILGLVEGLEETEYSDRIKETLRKYVGEEAILEGLDTILDATSGLLEAQAERDLAIEENKTNALNDQLKARLANEQLSAEERDRINQQIARNEAELVRKENEINKRRFEQQKALQLASATAELYRTAFLAYGSQLVIGDPTSPIRAQIAQGVALAAGLASIAMIAKQKFVGKAMPAPTLTAQGGGAPAESQGPAFNIVGASGQSQLAEAISAQTGKPVKAYVVSGEVSTAQSLERNRVKEASI